MASMAEIIIIGNVGKDAEMRMTPNGKQVTDFSVAVNKGKQGDPEAHTDWYRVSCWGRQAEIAQQYVKKGTSICVRGEFSPRSYTAKDGTARTSYDIQFANFTLLGSRPSASEGGFDPDNVPAAAAETKAELPW